MLRVCLGHAGRIQAEFGENSRRIQGEFRLNSQRMHLLRFVACLILLMVVGVGSAWGQDTDYSGVYYIASDYQTPNTTTRNYDFTTLTNNFYLCPTENWISFDSSGETTDTWTTGDANPFLTTYKARAHNDYDITKAKWTIEYYTTESSKDYYYIKHSSGQYVVLNKKIDGMKGNSPENRIRVHLETLSSEQLAVEATRNLALFAISPDGRSIFICPKTQSSVHLTINNGNGDYLKGNGNNKGTLVLGTTTYGMEGTIGIYGNSNTDDNKYLYLEDYITRPTITYNSSNLIEITDQTGSATAIYYTTDGTKPTTSSTLYTGAFDPAEGVTTIKAIAIVGDEASNVAVYTTPVLCGNTHSYLIQSQNNGWTIDENTTDFHFYMIPGDVDNNVQKVNTTSLFRPSMEWHFESAGLEDGVQFYYIVNNSAKDNENNPYYLCWDGTNVCMLIYDSNNANKFKFKIVESATAGSFNIIPYAQRNASGNTNRFVYKPNDGNNICNANANALSLSNTSNAHSQWKFVQSITLDKIAPFTVSDNDKTVYYNINSVGSNGYYIVPPSGTNTNATTSNSTDDNVIKTGAWYFEKAQDATDDDWLTYYHIRNAETGKYLYFTKEDNNAGACLIMKETIESGNEERYMFTWAKTAADNANYYIIPKLLKDKSLNKFSALQRDNGTLKTNLTRGAGNYAWTFTPADLFCNDPVFNENEGSISISCVPDITRIYYTTDGTDPDPTDENQRYVSTIPFSTTNPLCIKAISYVSNETTNASSNVVTLLNKPAVTLVDGPYTYKGVAWEPVSSVSVGTISTSSGYSVSYSGDHINVGDVTVTITDADTNDNLYIWNVPTTTFTITKAPLTATAENKVVSYGDAIPTYTATYTGLVNGETNPGFTTNPTFSCEYTPTSTVSSSPFTITVSGGVSPNYEITTYNSGTLTVNPAEVTVTADDKEKTYGESDPELTATVTGLKNEDAENVISYTLSRESGEAYGNYTITPSGEVAQGNYTVTYVTGTLSINRIGVTLTANSRNTDVYDGTLKTVTGYTCSMDGVTFTGVSASGSGTDASTYPVSFNNDVIGTIDESGNYVVAVATPGTLTINPKTLTITPDADQYKGFGDDDPVLTYTYSGLVEGDEITFNGALGREEGEDVGTYEINLYNLTSANSNYVLALTEEPVVYFTIMKSVGNESMAEGFKLEIGAGGDIILKDGETGLEEGVDYSVGPHNYTGTNNKYDTRTVSGVGNYTGYFTLRNANVSFQTDADRVEWSATFVAEPIGGGDADDTKGHALPDGMKAFIITDIDGDWAIPEPLAYIPEGIPVLLVSDKESGGFVVKNATPTEEQIIKGTQKEANMLKVTTSTTHFDIKTIFLLYKNEFIYNMSGDLAAGKVYLNPPSGSSPAPARLRIKKKDDTGIEDTHFLPLTSHLSDVWYTLDGRRLNGKPVQKGLYINEGKKIFIK